jgi:hypothetical protein
VHGLDLLYIIEDLGPKDCLDIMESQLRITTTSKRWRKFLSCCQVASNAVCWDRRQSLDDSELTIYDFFYYLLKAAILSTSLDSPMLLPAVQVISVAFVHSLYEYLKRIHLELVLEHEQP